MIWSLKQKLQFFLKKHGSGCDYTRSFNEVGWAGKSDRYRELFSIIIPFKLMLLKELDVIAIFLKYKAFFQELALEKYPASVMTKKQEHSKKF